jgi:hypothetical protein
MRWLCLFVAVGLVGAGCEKTVYRSHESQYCSPSDDDEPYFECARSSDLICINTYEKFYAQPNNQPDKAVQMWACHEACDPTAKNPCVGPTEICCPGNLFGRDYPAKRANNPMPYACVLREFCDAVLGAPVKDGGVKADGPAASDGGSADQASSVDQGSSADAGASDADDAAADL